MCTTVGAACMKPATQGRLPWFSPVFLGNRWYDVVQQTSQPRPTSGLTDCHTTRLQNQHRECLNRRKAECKPAQWMFHVCINSVSSTVPPSIAALRGVPVDTYMFCKRRSCHAYGQDQTDIQYHGAHLKFYLSRSPALKFSSIQFTFFYLTSRQHYRSVLWNVH